MGHFINKASPNLLLQPYISEYPKMYPNFLDFTGFQISCFFFEDFHDFRFFFF